MPAPRRNLVVDTEAVRADVVEILTSDADDPQRLADHLDRPVEVRRA
jgi:hypothetical protein